MQIAAQKEEEATDSLTWELIRDAESQPGPNALTQNLHFSKSPGDLDAYSSLENIVVIEITCILFCKLFKVSYKACMH